MRFAIRCLEVFNALFKLGDLDDLPIAALVPRPLGVGLAFISLSGRIVEILVDQNGRWRYFADRKWRFAHTFESSRESLHVRDLARHKELQCILRAGIVAKVNQSLIHNLGASLSRNIASEIHVQLACDL